MKYCTKIAIIACLILSPLVDSHAFENFPMEPPLSKTSKTPTFSSQTSSESFATSLQYGSATYNYKIELPPGTNQLAPTLSLNYDSSLTQDKSGLCGLGWDLNLNYIQRDVNFTPDDTSDDKFDLILNGTKYDLVYIATEDCFHTKIESHMWIRKLSGAPNQNSGYWVVREKDGKEYRFGYNADSENIASTRSYAWRWSLDQIKDSNDNKIFLSYQENPCTNDIGAVYPYQIQYNNEQKRLIEFVLEDIDRPDSYIFYNQGSKIRLSRRLKEIKVYLDGDLVRRYLLNYISSSCSNKSLLHSVTQYGDDGVSSLPPTVFTYQVKEIGFESSVNWPNPGGHVRKGFEIEILHESFDINRDGLVDYVKSSPGGNWQVNLNNGADFDTEINWSAPSFWVYFSDSYTYYSTFDINGDGLPDFIDASGSNNWKIYLNNGTGFDSQTIWPAPETWLGYSTAEDPEIFTYYDTFDINGDGLPDFVRSFQNGDWSVHLNNGSGFNPAIDWHVPSGGYLRYTQVEITEGDSTPKETFVYTDIFDINGDGLPDFVKTNCGNNWTVYINNGSGFDEGVNWVVPHFAIRSAESPAPDYYEFLVYYDMFDMNSDGLPDLVDFLHGRVAFNNGNGFDPYVSWPTPRPWVQAGEFLDVWDKLVDLNGDGCLDYVESFSSWNASNNKMFAIDLLSNISLSSGGSISISYLPSTQYENSGEGEIGDLGFIRWCVSSVIKDNGMPGPHQIISSYTYDYSGGLYDYEDKEFRGFAYVKEINPEGDLTEQYFHQDDILKGKLYKIERKDSSADIYAATEYTWNYEEEYSDPESIYFVYLAQEDELSYDGAMPDPKIARIQYAGYDDYGNIEQIIYEGDISIIGDEKYRYNEYVYNPTLWIVDKLKHTYLRASDNLTKASESWFAYDDGEVGDPPIKGSLTRKEDWLDTGDNPIEIYAYDSCGNQIQATDAENHATATTYDEVYNTFIVEIENAKQQSTLYNYDPTTGELLSIIDPNGFIISYEYDTFKRLIKEVYPYDSSSYPTVFYEYLVDGVAPEGVSISKRENCGQPDILQSFSFIDGFGKTIQDKIESEDAAKQVVTDTFYDHDGELDRVSVAYLEDTSPSYNAPDTSVRSISCEYDPLERVTKIINSDGAYKTNDYDRWKVTSINERGFPLEFIYDGYRRLVSVKEFNEGQVYTTSYEYDAEDNLKKITDNQGNQIIYGYDSLNRRISMNDPDMGQWHYAYDKVGNLISQTDAKGNCINFEYDELNRLKKRDYPIGADVSYSYDIETIGTLSAMIDSSGTTRYYYDDRKRKIREEKIISGLSYITQWAYDALDRVTAIVYPDNEQVDYSYTSQGEVESISGYLNNVDYSARGNIIRKDYANGVYTEFTYNEDDFRLSRIFTPGIQDLSYQYDDVGNVISITDNLNSISQVFIYDDLNRLTSANGGFYNTREFAYDSIGNILTKNDMVFNYGENAGPHAVTSIVDTSLTYNYIYDQNGNMLLRNPLPGQSYSQKIIYDYENRPKEIKHSNNNKNIKYVYDGDGNRVKKLVYRQPLLQPELSHVMTGTISLSQAQAVSESTVYVGSLYEKTIFSDNAVKSTKHIFLGSERIASAISGPGGDETLYLHSDHLGSSNAVTYQNGEVAQRIEYAPFGEVVYEQGRNETDYKFTGKELDAEVALYFYGARYYDPFICHFVSPDPIENFMLLNKTLSDGKLKYRINNLQQSHINSAVSNSGSLYRFYNPQEFNKYSYCLGNPINYIDPSGLKVLLGSRVVFWPGTHTAIVLQPDNPEDFQNHPRFYKNEHGQLESIISAGPKEGKLTRYKSDYEPDKPGNLKNTRKIKDPKRRSDTEFIEALLNSADKYGDDLPYDFLARDTEYNSNSYTAGILKDATGKDISVDFLFFQPGGDKPIPLRKE